jgi:hypothetical protein
MAVNVTVRDIVNFPGGTAKTVTVDVIQVVPAGSNPEGDEFWVSSATTTATASGGASIENIYKNELKRGWIRGIDPIDTSIDIPATARMKIAIDEDIGSGADITLTEGNGLTTTAVAQDIEDQIRNLAVIGGGGAKVGNLSYLNAQVRYSDGVFSIESGTVTGAYTGTSKTSVALGAPDSGTDVRSTLGFHITISSEDLAARDRVEVFVTSDYSTGDLLSIGSTASLSAGDAFMVTDGTNSDIALVSGTIDGSILQFTAVSGVGLGLAHTYTANAAIFKKLQEVNNVTPLSAITTVDQLYRFAIDSVVNQIDFSA